MIRKSVYLFIALLLPVLIFAFLKQFGKNEFDIPVYFAAKSDSLNSVCGTLYRDPYTVPDSVMNGIGAGQGRVIVALRDSLADNKELQRLSENFRLGEYYVVNIQGPHTDYAKALRWTDCAFFLHPPKNVVLIDSEKRIRGYYSSSTRDEVDRLIVEMKILLKKY